MQDGHNQSVAEAKEAESEETQEELVTQVKCEQSEVESPTQAEDSQTMANCQSVSQLESHRSVRSAMEDLASSDKLTPMVSKPSPQSCSQAQVAGSPARQAHLIFLRQCLAPVLTSTSQFNGGPTADHVSLKSQP